jgi:hypothetical protein
MGKKSHLLNQDHIVYQEEDIVLITKVVKQMKWFSTH